MNIEIQWRDMIKLLPQTMVGLLPLPPPLVEIRVEVMAKVAPLLVVFCVASISVMSRCSSVCDDKKKLDIKICVLVKTESLAKGRCKRAISWAYGLWALRRC
jgi:hypothetical protein